MQSLNVLILDDKNHQFLYSVKSSKYIKKLFIVSDEEFDGVLNIRFNTFKELAQKCKALQIDMVLVENEKWITQGVADVLRKEFVNCISPTSNITKFIFDKKYAKNLVKKYGISVPKAITLPTQYPLVVKSNRLSKIGNTLQDIINIRQEIIELSPELSESIFLEEYVEGFKTKLVSLYDGKNLITFPQGDVPSNVIEDFNSRLNKLLFENDVNFVGFLGTKVIYNGKKLYFSRFSLRYDLPQMDIMYYLISAIYQRLDEIK